MKERKIMDRIRQVAQDHLDGLTVGEEFYTRFMNEFMNFADSLKADENMLEFAKQLVKE